MNTDSLYRVAVDERYAMLRAALRVATSRPDWGLQLEQIAAIRAEIRALVRVRWFVRQQRRTAEARRQLVLTLPFHDWQSLPEAIDAIRGPSALTERELFAGYSRGGRP